jgi:hypothetical protein
MSTFSEKINIQVIDEACNLKIEDMGICSLTRP